jgi:hypothetical protein
MAIWYILWSFGIFSLFWYFVPRKIWQPAAHGITREKDEIAEKPSFPFSFCK